MIAIAGNGPGAWHAIVIVVVGCGGIGLPLAVAFASRDLRVLGYDVDVRKVDDLNDGRVDVFDQGLARALDETLAKGTLRFTTNLERVSASRVLSSRRLRPRRPSMGSTPAPSKLQWRRSPEWLRMVTWYACGPPSPSEPHASML